MSIQPFILPKSTDIARLDELAATLLESPEFLRDSIVWLESSIADHKQGIAQDEAELAERRQRLAELCAAPANDRRVSDAPNVTSFEFVCRLIERSCEVFLEDDNSREIGWMVDWAGAKQGHTAKFENPEYAWRAAFSILDRRGAK